MGGKFETPELIKKKLQNFTKKQENWKFPSKPNFPPIFSIQVSKAQSKLNLFQVDGES
jgi:hypothetical protein